MNFLTENGKDIPMSQEEKEILNSLLSYKDKFKEAMDDDLNTADAISHIFTLVREVNSKIEKEKCQLIRFFRDLNPRKTSSSR